MQIHSYSKFFEYFNRTSKSRSFPYSASDQLKWSRADLLPRSSDTNDDGFTPSFVTSLQRSSHGVYVTNTLESVIQTTICHLYQNLTRGVKELKN